MENVNDDDLRKKCILQILENISGFIVSISNFKEWLNNLSTEDLIDLVILSIEENQIHGIRFNCGEKFEKSPHI
ncbi:MAG: hypothetical protein PHF86_01510 [Candidatus Nanoarchaeia archaeon]|nr:hypothetical protein [Candidatus Nanoarchaeia archaeon]